MDICRVNDLAQMRFVWQFDPLQLIQHIAFCTYAVSINCARSLCQTLLREDVEVGATFPHSLVHVYSLTWPMFAAHLLYSRHGPSFI